MPLEASAFPQEVQVAFFMFDLLSDRWDGMSGMYLGKDWGHIDFLFDLYGYDDRKEIIYFMKVYENLVINQKAEESERRRKAAERKAKSK
tara:strand:+ start:1752 stop:2021 length:270 start_codon:yes stop_codon:yes gene_type:complete